MKKLALLFLPLMILVSIVQTNALAVKPVPQVYDPDLSQFWPADDCWQSSYKLRDGAGFNTAQKFIAISPLNGFIDGGGLNVVARSYGSDLLINANVKNGNKSLPVFAIPGAEYEFTTTPLDGTYSNVPVAYYTYKSAGETITKTFDFPVESDGTVLPWTSSTGKEKYALNGNESTFSLSLPPAEQIDDSVVNVHVAYFKTIELRYYLPNGTDFFSARVSTQYIREQDILTIEEIDDYLAANNRPDRYGEAYVLAGWYHQVNTANAFTVSAKLSDYKDLLVESSIFDNGGVLEYLDVIDTDAAVYELYPRLQYKVTINDSASVNLTGCGNAGAGEGEKRPVDEEDLTKKYDYRLGSTLAPPNNYNDYVVLIDKPAQYAGDLRYEIFVGDKLLSLADGDYTQALQESGLTVTIRAKNLKPENLLGKTDKTMNGIRVNVYHTNMQVIAEERAAPVAGVTATTSGVFTVVYNINHAVRTYQDAGGNSHTLKTYGFTDTSRQNNIIIHFDPPLSPDTLVEMHRIVDYQPNEKVPQQIFWYKTTGSQANFALQDFAPTGGLGGASTQTFSSYLDGKTYLAERFYIVVQPGAGQRIPDETAVSIAINGINSANEHRYDSLSVPVAGKVLAAVPTENAGLELVNKNPNAGQIKCDIGLIAQAGTAYGIAIYFTDEDGKDVLLPDDSAITLEGITRTSTQSSPLSRAFFRAGTGIYNYSVAQIPENAKAMVFELIRVKSTANLEPDYEEIKLAGGQIRSTAVISLTPEESSNP